MQLSGESWRIRTFDQLVKSQLLYHRANEIYDQLNWIHLDTIQISSLIL